MGYSLHISKTSKGHKMNTATANREGTKTVYTVTLEDGRTWTRTSSRQYNWVVVIDSAAWYGTEIVTNVEFSSREPRATAPELDAVRRPVVNYFRIAIA